MAAAAATVATATGNGSSECKIYVYFAAMAVCTMYARMRMRMRMRVANIWTHWFSRVQIYTHSLTLLLFFFRLALLMRFKFTLEMRVCVRVRGRACYFSLCFSVSVLCVFAVVFVLRFRLFCHYYCRSPLTLLLHTIYLLLYCVLDDSRHYIGEVFSVLCYRLGNLLQLLLFFNNKNKLFRMCKGFSIWH